MSATERPVVAQMDASAERQEAMFIEGMRDALARDAFNILLTALLRADTPPYPGGPAAAIDAVAGISYQHADAMLAARARPRP